MPETKPSRKSWTLKQLMQLMDLDTETIALSDDKKHACILDEESNRMKALFVKGSYGRYVKLDLPSMVRLIVDKLAPHFDAQNFLEELILLQTPPEEVDELFQRLGAPHVSVKQHRDCYTLRIGGKKGRPFDFVTVT